MANLKITIVFDIGSSSVRAAAFTSPEHNSKNPVIIEGTLHQQQTSFNDRGEGDSKYILDQVELCLDRCLHSISTLEEKSQIIIDKIGFTSFAMSWMGVDKQGDPVTPLYTYARRGDNSEVAVNSLRTLLGQERLQSLYSETGVPIHAAYAPALIYQLTTEEPLLIEKVVYWQTIGSWIISRWCGMEVAPISTCEASWAGLLDIHSGKWHNSLTHSLGLKTPSTENNSDKVVTTSAGSLPEVYHFSEDLSIRVGGSSESERSRAAEYAKRWPWLTGAKVSLPIGDGAAAALGSGCDGYNKRISLTVGTSAAVRVVLRSPITESSQASDTCKRLNIPFGLWCYRIDSERVVLGGALTDGGSYVEWLSALLYGGDVETAMTEASQIEPSHHGLQVLPFLGPERSPGWHGDASGCINGLKRSTSRAQLMRASLDAVALRIRAILDLVQQNLPDVDCESSLDWILFGSGGALAKSELWRTTLANATGRSLIVDLGSPELTLTGLALSLNHNSYSEEKALFYSSSVSIPGELETRPDLKCTDQYTEMADDQLKLYNSILSPTSDFSRFYL